MLSALWWPIAHCIADKTSVHRTKTNPPPNSITVSLDLFKTRIVIKHTRYVKKYGNWQPSERVLDLQSGHHSLHNNAQLHSAVFESWRTQTCTDAAEQHPKGNDGQAERSPITVHL